MMLCVLAQSAMAAVPAIVPARDVTVAYDVAPRGHAPLQVRVSFQGGGRLMRISAESLPTAFLIDRPAHMATILLPVLKLYATASIADTDPTERLLKQGHFDRHGAARVAGLPCTNWTAIAPHVRADACITPDGVVLRGSAVDENGPLGTVRALHVQYGRLPPELFERPPGFTNAGSLPIDGLANMAQ